MATLLFFYTKYQQQLSWLGGNFNQVMHRANELAIDDLADISIVLLFIYAKTVKNIVLFILFYILLHKNNNLET